MIKEIHIENFQSHKNTTLKLSKGVNVITGSSDSGKTAIIRALTKLVWNKPSGDSFCSSWGGKTAIEVFTDDLYLGYFKKGNDSEYILGDTHFKAFGTSVPEEIQAALNLTEINLQQQLDSPFLLSETSGNVAQYFNKIAKLDKIDTTTQNVNKAIREINNDIKYQNEQLKKYKKELEEYPNLVAIEIKLDEIEDKEKERNKISGLLSSLNKLIILIDDVEERIEESSGILKFEKTVNKTIAKIKAKEELNENIIELAGILEDIEMCEYKTQKLNKKIKLEKIVNNVLNKIANTQILIKDKRILYGLISNIATIKEKLLKTQKKVATLEKQYGENFPDVCPLCGTPKTKVKL
jgi:exonuclease SbcC